MRVTVASALVIGLLAATMVIGTALRLADPLSTRALGAEDPYTHVVLTKEWTQQGYFADSYDLGTELYPPGMHAFLGAFVPFTGVPLYEFARIAPVFFGALAILGMFVLAHKLGGPVAGLGAAFLTAIMPEHIFRTELMFPTALDLALLPVWLYAFVLVLEKSRAGTVLFGLVGIPLAIMHPWLVPLFAVPLALFAVLRAFRGGHPIRSLAAPAALLVGVTAFAVAFRWDQSDTGFADFAARAPGLGAIAGMDLAAPMIFVAVAALLGALAACALGLLALLPRPRLPARARIVIGVVLAAGAVALVVLLASRPLPHEVSYKAMLGPLAIGLGLAGLALAFARPSALADLGLGVSAILLPLTAIDLFGSPYWPQRTVVYLSVGVALLGAAAVAEIARLPLHVPRLAASRATGAATILVLAVAATGAVAAEPVDTYSWYRLYDEEDFAGFERVAAILGQHPEARVFIYTWEPALLVRALAEGDPVWYSPKFFRDGASREKSLGLVHGPAYVLVDKNTREAEDRGKADLGFLDGSRYHETYATPSGSLILYEVMR